MEGASTTTTSTSVSECHTLTSSSSDVEPKTSDSPQGMCRANTELTSWSMYIETSFEGVDIRDFEENTPLLRAASEGQHDTVKLLLEQGACPDSQNIYGYTPLLSALSHGHMQIALLLLQHGASVHLCSVEVRSLFHTPHPPSSLSSFLAHSRFRVLTD